VATILCLATLTTAYYISPVFKERGVQGYNDVTSALTTDAYNDSFGIRLYLWRVGLNIFKKNPLIGTGIGDEKEGFQYHLKEYEDFSKYTNILNEEHVDFHSMYIQHAVHLGLTGFILMLLLIYSIFMIKFKSLLYRNINITFATSILIYSLVGNVLHAIFPLAYFVFFVSTLSAISRVENKT
jgi:O-antigen ligase